MNEQKILTGLQRAISEDNAENFKKLIDLITDRAEYQIILRNYSDNATNPIKNTNLVILACKHNAIKVLEYLFSIDSGSLFVALKGTTILPDDQDESHHNALYYAIRSGNIELLDMLINKWPGDYFGFRLEELDEILSKAYEELKLKNVPLSDEMEVFVENKLINLRFYSNVSRQDNSFMDDLKNIRERMEFLLESIVFLQSEYSNTKKVDEKFLFLAKSIAQNIHTLKRQLKSTYRRLPWEEIEFCLVSFVASNTKRQEINVFFRATLNKSRLLNHLENFAKKLEEEKSVIEGMTVDKLAELPKFPREKIVAEIINNYPQFEELYHDYRQIRDIHSLQKINDHIQVALSADPKEIREQLIITRAFQVIGEYLKNTLESPKLSITMSELLLLSLPKNARKIIMDLRNSISHVHSLLKRWEIQENADFNFFLNVQNDIKKVGDVISDIFYNNKIKTIGMLLTKIVFSKKLQDIEEVAEVLSTVELEVTMSTNFKMLEHEKLEEIVKELSDAITDQTYYEKELFNKINSIIPSAGTPLEQIKIDYLTGLSTLKSFCDGMKDRITDESVMKAMKFRANRILKMITPKIEPHSLKEIAKLATEIYHSVGLRRQSDDELEEVMRLIRKIYYKVEIGTDDIKWIEELREKLNEKGSFIPKHQQKQTYFVSEETYNEQLALKLSELKSILSNNSLSGSLAEKFFFYKNDKKLQAVLEMLVLDIMSILGSSQCYFENNQLFLDDRIPLLTGKCLRNYLAHGDALVDVLSDTSKAVFLNAKKLTEENLMGRKKPIGKFVANDPSKLREKFVQSLAVIINQERMFMALEEGNLENFKDCLKEKSDINARSINLWTTLHFAAMGPSLEAVKFILQLNLSVDVKDIYGQSPLHIAAAHGRQNIVEFFIEEKHLKVDVLNNFDQTPLHVAAQNGHLDTVEVLLKNQAETITYDMIKFSPVHYAIQNNHIDIAKILLKKDVNVDINEASSGFTPLNGATERGNLEIVNFLLENKANVNAGDDRNWRPLHAAAYNGYVEIVNALIRKGAEVNAQVVNGCTALYYAVENANEMIVNILLKHGAKVNATHKISNSTPLHYAAKTGHTAIVKHLLNNKANAGVADVEGTTPLHFAVHSGNLEIIAALLKHGVDIHSKDNKNATPLHHAAFNGHTEVAKLLISNRAEINVVDHNNITPLHMAALNGHKAVVDLLIKHKVRIAAKDVKGSTPLHAAALSGRKEVIQLLVKHGAEINSKTNDGMTPLHFAALHGHVDTSVYLIQNKAQVDARAMHGLTPLHSAVVGGHKDVVNLLIKSDAQVDVNGIEDSTPLHLAVEAGNKDIVEILATNGANVNVKSSNKITPLLSAIKCNRKDIVEVLIANGANVNDGNGEALLLTIHAGYKDILEILLKNKASVNIKCNENVTPLHFASNKGHNGMVKALIRRKANVDAIDIHNETPLCFAARAGHEEVVEILIASGANVNVKSNENYTPLWLAASNGHFNVLKVLLQNGANINDKDSENRTPLEMAVSYGHLQLVKIILQYKKVDMNAKGNDGWTILHIASQGSNFEMIKYLVDQGADVNARNASGSKSIHIAAREGFKDTVEFFISKGLSIHDRGAANQTLLHYAAMKGHLEIVNYLLAQGSDIDPIDANGSSPIHIAAMFGYKDIIEVLLQKGAVYNALDNFYRRPVQVAKNQDVINLITSTEKLFEAVKRNKLPEVENSIKTGAIVNAKNSHGRMPLHYASWKGYESVVNVLLEFKANPNLVGSRGVTPLHYAAKFSHIKIVKALLSNNAVYNAVSDSGKTPADFTADKVISSLFKLLNESFRHVTIGNSKVISNLEKIKDVDTIRAIMNAHNRENKTLIAAAMHNNFSKIQQLKEILQGDVSTRINAALVLFNEGNYQGALHIFKNAFEKRKKILGSDNPGTLDIQTYIAQTLYIQGVYQEALNTYEDIFRKQKKILGLDEKNTLNTRGSIALVLHRLGRDEEAFNIYREIYPKQKEILGPNHSDTLGTQFHMALVLERRGKHEEALNINRAIYEKHKEMSGAYDQNAVRAQNNIAMVLASQGNYEEALKIYREVFKKKRAVLGVNHSDTLRTLHNIAGVLLNQKKYHEALTAHREILSIQIDVLGPNHPDTLNSQHNLGTVLFVQSKWISALKVFRKCLDPMKAVFGPNHPSVLDILKKMEALNMMFKIQGHESSEILQKLQNDINIAADNGDVRSVQRLLQNGIDANDSDIDGRTPLHFAVSNGYIDVVNVLLKNGADVTQITNKGNTSLHTATSKGHKEIVDVLCKHVSHDKLSNFINAKTAAGGATPLHVAAKNGSFDVAKSLLKRGAIYNIRNNECKTPLDLSKEQNVGNLLKLIEELFQDAKNSNFKIMDKLKAVQPDELAAITNARDNEGHTLLQAVITNKRKNVVKELLEMLKHPL